MSPSHQCHRSHRWQFTRTTLRHHLRRTLSPGLHPQCEDVHGRRQIIETFWAYHNRASRRPPLIFCAVGLTPPPSQVQPIAPGAYAATLRSVRVNLRLSRTNSDDEYMERWLAGLNNRSLQQRPTSKGAYSHVPGPVLPTPRPSRCSGRNVVGRYLRLFAHKGVRALCHPKFPTSETDQRVSPGLDSLRF
ncbi:hypothetical protein E4U49_007021 [Claviceps purpurea]|nr:hypothetical protein E4U49_007021 [Claviceps purpurea]